MTDETIKQKPGKLETIISVATGIAIGAGATALTLPTPEYIPSIIKYCAGAAAGGYVGLFGAAAVRLGEDNAPLSLSAVCATIVGGGALGGILYGGALFGETIAGGIARGAIGGAIGFTGAAVVLSLFSKPKLIKNLILSGLASSAILYGGYKLSQTNYQPESALSTPSSLQVHSRENTIEMISKDGTNYSHQLKAYQTK